MENQTIFALCALILTVGTQTEAKSYRKDYVYDWRTDAFYKLHIDSDSKLRKEDVCALEGAKLMAPMSTQELSETYRRVFQDVPYTEEDGDRQQYDSFDGQSIIDLESDAKDVLEMSCRVTTRDGYVKTRSVFHDVPLFMCKVEAKDVSYDSKCRVHTKGYQYFPSVGSCYKVPRVAFTWHQAAAECHAEGAYLTVINSEQEALVLKTFLSTVADIPDSNGNSYFHIGFRAVKLTAPREFRTIFNETLEAAGFSEWATGEPSSLTEQCGSIYRSEGKLNDINCHYRYGFVCKKEVICHNH